MITFFTFILIIFLVALSFFAMFVYRIYRGIRKVKNAFSGGANKSDSKRSYVKKWKRSATRNTASNRIIPEEYAEDVQYTEEHLTGTESFSSTDTHAVSSHAETQVSDADYEIIND